MFIRAYRNPSNIVFLSMSFDGPWVDSSTGKPATITGSEHPLFADLEFLNWETGKSRYCENGRML